MFLWFNICTTFEHAELPRLGLIVVEGEKGLGWSKWISLLLTVRQSLESPVVRQVGATVVNPWRDLDGCSLCAGRCWNALVEAEVETQGSPAGVLGEFFLQPDLRHLPCGDSSCHTSCICAKQYWFGLSFPQEDGNKIRIEEAREKKLVFDPGLINWGILGLFPKNMNFCSVSLRLHE